MCEKESLMATETTTTADSNGNNAQERPDLRYIPLAQITVEEGFNPRGEIVDDAELDALAETMRERGCLQPVLVRATGTDAYRLVAGGRRYCAATKAELAEVPAKVLAPGQDGEDEELELLTDAMIENELRSDLDPVRRARGYKRMMDRGLNVRGVAERLGGKAKRGSRERRIREHLAILALPEDIRELVAAATIPLLAVKALAEVCKIEVELARNAIAAVLNPEEHSEPYTWAEIASEALSIGVLASDPLPAGLFQAARRYPMEMFTLSEKATKSLAAYQKASGRSLDGVFFTPDLVEQARLLGALHKLDEWSALTVGQDVADRLAEDFIANNLKTLRANLKREREAQKAHGAAAPAGRPAAQDNGRSAKTETPQQRAERMEQEAQAQRKEQEDKREKATRFNAALGLLAFKHLPKIKVDEQVLRVLASVNLGGDLRGIAARGARLALPGWFTQTTTASSGKTKTVYLEPQEASDRASRFLSAAQSASDMAGRALTLIVLASFADEDAIAVSRQSHYGLYFSGPWAGQAERDLNALVRERIKEGQLPELDGILAERIAQDQEAARLDAEISESQARLDALTDQLDQLDTDGLDQALIDAEIAWGRFNPKTLKLRNERERRGSTETSPEDSQSDTEEAVATA
jgi:ParB/RepB/Spo0J family partition protein